MKNNEELLPVGSVITTKLVKVELRNTSYLIITGRFFIKNIDDKKYFDYECDYYPGGTKDGKRLYINHEYVEQVIFRGYEDEKEIKFKEKMLETLKETGFQKAKGNISK